MPDGSPWHRLRGGRLRGHFGLEGSFEVQHTCRVCGIRHDRAAAVVPKGSKPHPPKAGDVNLCIDCGAVSVYTAAGGLRPPTDDERDEALAMRGVTEAILWIKSRPRMTDVVDAFVSPAEPKVRRP